jgi:ligand-binding sensor domain-containing protein
MNDRIPSKSLAFFAACRTESDMSRQSAKTDFLRGFAIALALMAGGGFPGLAAPPDYFMRTWQVENGLPQNKVTAVVQTHDGYLWLSTYNGLAKFDGVRFTVFDENNTPELRSSRITSLFEAPDGVLWIGDESGQVTQCKNGRFQAVPFHAAWSGGKIESIATDDAGDVWLLNGTGELARVRDGLVLRPPAGLVANVVSMTSATNGTIWVARDGRVSVLRHGRLHAAEFEGVITNAYIQGIGASRDGGLWVASDGLLREWKNGQWVVDLGAAPWGWHDIATVMMETRNGVLCAGTANHGLYMIFPGQMQTPLHFDRAGGFPSDWVISLCQDREGDIWSGTGAGLAMARPNNVETVSPPDQWQSRAVLSVYPARNGALWVGTEGAGLYRLQDGGWTNFDSPQGIRNSYIWSLAEDAAGRLLAGTWGGGLFVQKGESFDFAPGMEKVLLPMPALLAARDVLWIGTTTGLLRYHDGAFTNLNHVAGDVRAIAVDKQGAVWIGTAGNGLACLEDNKVRWFKKADGLSSDFIECLRFEKDGTLWIGTFGGGLNRFKNGRFAVINREQGLPNSVIGDIEVDDYGFFWLSTFGGIIRVSGTELNRCADGMERDAHWLTYGINDGLPTLECSEGLQPAGAKTADGRLWFPTAKGLVVVDPANVKINTVPPPVVIESMRVDDRKLASAAPLKIPPGRHRFEFQFTGLSFVAPEKVRFKYRLKGFDDNWVDAGTKRLAGFNYIPPGRYSFQVLACNNDGVWNEKGAGLSFEVLPFFWQTAWFRLLALTMLLAASGGLVWFFTRQRMRRKARP